MAITIRVDDETGAAAAEHDIFSTSQQRNGLAFNGGGAVALTAPVTSTVGFLALDFAAFADTAGAFAAKAAALEARLQATGRIPA